MDNTSIRIAVITDVHGNLPALKAVLQRIRDLNCDEIYHLGDAIGMGPDPQPCLELLLSTDNLTMVMGNHDAYFVNGFKKEQLMAMDALERAHHLWIHKQVDPRFREAMKAVPYFIKKVFSGVKANFLHYPIDEDKGSFKAICHKPSGEALDQVFEGIEGDVIFYGHHHPFSDIKGRLHYINPGSLGCSRDAFGRFTLVEFSEKSYRVEHNKVPYDLGAVYEAFDEKDVPGREFVAKAFFGKKD